MHKGTFGEMGPKGTETTVPWIKYKTAHRKREESIQAMYKTSTK